MNTILLSAGVVALMSAVIGGGLKAFNIELPVLKSAGVRAGLGALGVAFLITALENALCKVVVRQNRAVLP